MPTIKFSYTYNKLFLDGKLIKEAILLDVIPVKIENLSKDFLNYDTDQGEYKLPKKGEYLLLIFQKSCTNIFTTLRRYIPEKEEYYRKLIGETFTIEYTGGI